MASEANVATGGRAAGMDGAGTLSIVQPTAVDSGGHQPVDGARDEIIGVRPEAFDGWVHQDGLGPIGRTSPVADN